MTNREKAQALIDEMISGRRAWVVAIEAALTAERKAGELDGRIEALEWCQLTHPLFRNSETVCFELARLRAEKAKLG